jgi:hypothetical protein
MSSTAPFLPNVLYETMNRYGTSGGPERKHVCAHDVPHVDAQRRAAYHEIVPTQGRPGASAKSA